MVKIEINGTPLEVEAGTTIIEASKKIEGLEIPALCYMNLGLFKLDHHVASCRICMVEVTQGQAKPRLMPSCAVPVAEGMKIVTNTPEIINHRRNVLELLLSDHPFECLTCGKNLECELQTLAKKFNIHEVKYKGEQSTYPLDISSKAIKRDLNKCIMCRRCETMCNTVQTVGTLTGYGRGFTAVVGTAGLEPLKDTNCTFCGQCVSVCPTAALAEINYTKDVWSALANPKKTVVVQTAPAVRTSIGEEFGFAAGYDGTGKLVAGLKKMGFNAVFSTDFAADLTIMEESKELIDRIQSGKNLPILTSCCPGWVNFLEQQFPSLLNIPSTCKSPMQMSGAITKSYYAQKIGIDPKDLVVVAIMPCLAKKYEAGREEFTKDGVSDVDYVLSVRELAKMFREAGVNFAALPDAEFDNPLGEATGAGTIFATTGGVIEAALRTAYETVTGQELKGSDIEFHAVRTAMEGVKEAVVDFNGLKLNIAITNGLGNARKVLEKIEAGEANYHAIEIMACPGGCIGGGGQPYIHGDTGKIEARRQGLYKIDGNDKLRKSHLNPSIQKLYKEFLGEPGGHKAHELLHTHYSDRSKG
ncbi:MAG: NADH-dependent [FeFe] hydrogenase, group A6 [Spirochaetaceae bacterium]|nr:NADH-dependent [FeFe] hydrogenase, group A6 [Spirochaetaceae bacterium]